MEIPEDLRYTREHEWARRKGSAIVVGITDFAQEQLGDVVYVELPDVGDTVKKGESFGVVESTKAVSELFAPISGKVIEVNDPLSDAPETINEDPYEEGWMITIEPSDPKDLETLMDAAAYKAFVEEQE
ncbi:glycine cleavage system protein GcvH [Anaeromyxobacter sp. PSR-1]|uniref:glycine cleavage system protein GcvH n=1 Tax=unclassified Anaeromyxobacter TaxID=2620896 RepID=UPI0005E0A228|nr:glycine cleavage system protein GcvH [Anaeromyxobacter sp. PSR-1]GAO04505.1 glycine cleavage system H protein [Anaeromyxobacter sp. PSR-1]